jgi:hypothetical protein
MNYLGSHGATRCEGVVFGLDRTQVRSIRQSRASRMDVRPPVVIDVDAVRSMEALSSPRCVFALVSYLES